MKTWRLTMKDYHMVSKGDAHHHIQVSCYFTECRSFLTLPTLCPSLFCIFNLKLRPMCAFPQHSCYVGNKSLLGVYTCLTYPWLSSAVPAVVDLLCSEAAVAFINRLWSTEAHQSCTLCSLPYQLFVLIVIHHNLQSHLNQCCYVLVFFLRWTLLKHLRCGQSQMVYIVNGKAAEFSTKNEDFIVCLNEESK